MMFTRAGLVLGLLVTGCLSRPLTESKPTTTNLFVDQVKQSGVDKIDLLFMVDNSASMADKQEILKDAVPVLLSRLVSPICIDGAGKPTGVTVLPSGQCPVGKGRPEFNAIGDIHIGIVSSSLGAHGGSQCANPLPGHENNDDRAHLIGSMRSDRFASARTWNNSGFLAWDSAGKANSPSGTSDPVALNSTFQDMIEAVGERGCGYEASLESWYRFLIDPEPPAKVEQVGGFSVRNSKLTVNADGSTGACVGCDETLLAQRRAFLRPDSLVAIIMLSDENDCSIRDDSVGWLLEGENTVLAPATSQCATNPNDPCCRYCDQKEPNGPPKGCPALADDAACKAPRANGTDSTNLRCFEQKRRFGFDLLYETSRYVNALTKTTLQLQSTPGVSVKNPLFDAGASGKAPRDASLVFLAGIVGVPWQDIADDASLSGPGLTYLTAKELNEKGRWRALLGDPSANPPVLPSEPFMVESTAARGGRNEIANVSVSSANSTNPRENPINGHERNIPKLDDLQYACTFPLKTPKACANGDTNCDCSANPSGDSKAVVTENSPLCQGGASINSQMFAKAYPGTRELSVLQGLGENAIVASICPKVIVAADPDNPSADPNYGYNPAVSAILERLKSKLTGKCLPRAIQAEQGQVLCRVVEAQAKKDACDCGITGRGEVPSDDIRRAVRQQLAVSGDCGAPGQIACSDWCMCEIKQVDASHLQACQANEGGVPPGYCYVDDQAKVGASADTAQAIEEQLSLCSDNERHLLRFVDSDPAHKTPAPGAFTFIACAGEALTTDQ
jgi:hypothetical protein